MMRLHPASAKSEAVERASSARRRQYSGSNLPGMEAAIKGRLENGQSIYR
jgi:hypothetical protein